MFLTKSDVLKPISRHWSKLAAPIRWKNWRTFASKAIDLTTSKHRNQ